MKCEKCGKEATVHEVVIRGQQRVDRHLCEACARAEGMPVQPHISVPAILSQFLAQQAAEAAKPGQPSPAGGDPSKSQCRVCGTTYGQFRHSGLLGCPECYAAFEVPLGPLLQRAHEGGTHHTGKAPHRVAPRPHAKVARGSSRAAAAPKPEKAPRIEALQKQLAAAVAAEQYEAAAQLRDQLRRLEQARAAPSESAGKPQPARPGETAGSGEPGPA